MALPVLPLVSAGVAYMALQLEQYNNLQDVYTMRRNNEKQQYKEISARARASTKSVGKIYTGAVPATQAPPPIVTEHQFGSDAPIAIPNGSNNVAHSDPISTEKLDDSILEDMQDTTLSDGITGPNNNRSGVQNSSDDFVQDDLALDNVSTVLPVTSTDIYTGVAPHVSSNNEPGVSSLANPEAIKSAELMHTKWKEYVNDQTIQVEVTYQKIKNVENELLVLDNIAYMNDIIITDVELQNKVESRIKRAHAIQKEIRDIAVSTKDKMDMFYFPLIAYDEAISSFISMMSFLHEYPDNRNIMNDVTTIISASLKRTSIVIERLKAKHDESTNRFLSAYAKVMEGYQHNDESERNMSKILKYDVDNSYIGFNKSSPKLSKLERHMKQRFNSSTTRSLQMQRKMRENLNVMTLQSKIETEQMLSNIKINNKVTDAMNTLEINTNNILQKYPKAPFGVKTPSRRLNLLETPLALKTAPSVPYVNEYEKTKRLFS